MTDFFEHYENWKEPIVSQKQFELNKKELSSKSNYPKHWLLFLRIIEKENPVSILDVGCGVGSYVKLLSDNGFKGTYFGIDYSPSAIEKAKTNWDVGEFLCMDYKDLTQEFLSNFDLIHMGAFLDVLPDADKALDFFLSLKPKKMLISRIEMTRGESHYDIYDAYDSIKTYRFKHNQKNLILLFESKGYSYEFIENNILIKRNLNKDK